jgi:phage-related protein
VEDKKKPELDVKFYKSPSGNEPVREWLKSLSKELKKIIGEDIRTAQIVWPLGMSIVKHLKGKLWEVRSSIPNGIARVFFTIRGKDMVLLHAFFKKTQKTPSQELETAIRRLKDFED